MISHSRLLLLVAVFSLTANAADTLKEKPLSGAEAKPSFKLPNANTTTTSGVKPVLKRPAPVGLDTKAKLQTAPKISSPQIKPGFKMPSTPAGIKPGFKGDADMEGRQNPAGVGAFIPTPDASGLGHKGAASRPDPGNVSLGSGPNSQAGFTGTGGDVQGAVPDRTTKGGVNAGADGVPVIEAKAKAEPTPGSSVQYPFVGGATTGSSSGGNLHVEAKESFSSTGESTYTLGNGQQVPRVGGGGDGMPDDKGGVLYPDGTYINVGDDGGTNVFNPDGSRDEGHSRPGVGGEAYDSESGPKPGGFDSGLEGSKPGFGMGGGVQPRVTGVGGEAYYSESGPKPGGFDSGLEGSKSGFGTGGGVQPRVTGVGGEAYYSESGPKPGGFDSGLEGSKPGFGMGGGAQPQVTRVGGEAYYSESGPKPGGFDSGLEGSKSGFGTGGGSQPRVTRVGGEAYGSESGPKPGSPSSGGKEPNNNGGKDTKDTSSEDTSGEDTGSEDTGSEDTSSEDTSSEDTSSEDTSGEDTGSEDTGSEDTSSEDTSGEDTSGEDTSGEDTSGEEAADESQTGFGTGSYGSYTSEGTQAVDAAAQPGNNEVESTAPGPCGDEEGGMVMDQQEADNCLPGGMPGKGDEDDDDPKPPGADSIWQAPSSSGGVDTVIQPGIDDEQFNDEGVAPLENIGRQIDSVTNPGGGN